jgi:hypothetical protein
VIVVVPGEAVKRRRPDCIREDTANWNRATFACPDALGWVLCTWLLRPGTLELWKRLERRRPSRSLFRVSLTDPRRKAQIIIKGSVALCPRPFLPSAAARRQPTRPRFVRFAWIFRKRNLLNCAGGSRQRRGLSGKRSRTHRRVWALSRRTARIRVVVVQRLYQRVRRTGPVVDRTFQIEFLDPGVQAFSFTFG